MGVFDSILHLPYAYLWLPGLVFLFIMGLGLLLLRRGQAVSADAVATSVTSLSVAAKPRDQRGASRRQGNTVEVHVATSDNKQNYQIGNVLDRSVGGLRLALYHDVEVGTFLSLRPTTADEMVPWVDIEVRSCKSSKEFPGQFEVGCQYVKSPPYSIQLLFG